MLCHRIPPAKNVHVRGVFELGEYMRWVRGEGCLGLEALEEDVLECAGWGFVGFCAEEGEFNYGHFWCCRGC